MIVQIDDLLKDVRVSIDHNKVSEPLVTSGDIDTLSLDDIIKSKVLDAVRTVEMTAPVYMLEGGHSFAYDGENDASQIYWGEDGTGWILLPDDFMRLVAFQMSDWERPCVEAISASDPAYQLQRSSIAGIRGNWQRPVCAITARPEGKVLEFYSSKDDAATVTRAVYIPYPEVDKNGGVDVSKRCYRSIVYMCAGLSLATIGEDNMSSNMMNLSKNLLI